MESIYADHVLHSRRRLLRQSGLGAFALTASSYFAPGAFAEALTQTPAQTEGPFYPDKLPLDTDNDLLVVNNSITPAVGEVTYLSGRVLGPDGRPVRNALVEIWQVDSTAHYIHTRSASEGKPDKNFQGFGRFLTASTGDYAFRTIKPVAYPGRTPHIHFKVKIKGKEALTTQCYVKGDPRNERDGVLRSVRDPKQLAAVLVDFAPLQDSKIGELAAKFDIVLGFTPEA